MSLADRLDNLSEHDLSCLQRLLSYKPTNEKTLAFHKSTAKTRLLLGGKRSSKSTTSVVEALFAALGIHPYLDYPEPPLKIRYCSVDFTSGVKGIALPMFKYWVGSFDNGPVIKKFYGEDRILEFRNETVIDFKCFSEDTEVLTEAGWKLFKDLNKTEQVMTVNMSNGYLEWQKPIAYWEYDYVGKMIYGKGEKLDFLVTPTHNMLVLNYASKRSKSKYHLRAAIDLNKRDAAPTCFNWEGNDCSEFVLPLSVPLPIPMDVWVSFLGMYLSEGSSSNTQVVISQYPGVKKERMREMITRMPFKVVEFDKGFRISHTEFAIYMRKFGLSHEKFIPTYVKNLSKTYLLLLLEFLMLGDGSTYTNKKGWVQRNYTSKSKQLLDDLQEVLLKLGLNGSFFKVEGSNFYRSNIYNSKKISLWKSSSKQRKSHLSEVLYTGKVYCLTTPNHTVMTRRNGKMLMTSQSYDQDLEKFEGVERHLVIEDEIPPLDIHQSNFMRTISNNINGKLVIAGTPLHGLDWVYDQLYDNPEAVPPAVEYWHIRTDENPYIGADAIEAIKKDPSMRSNIDAALYGEFIPKSGLVFGGFSGANVIEPIKVTDDHMILLGIDPHDRNPWGVPFIAFNRENEYIVYDEILQPGTVPELAAAIKKKLGARLPQVCVMDTAGNIVQTTSGRSIKEQLMTFGLYCQNADKDVSAGILTVNSLLNPGEKKRPRLFITKNCVNTLRQVRHIIWEDWARNRSQKDPKERILKKDDHLWDAIRYVCMVPLVYRHPGFSVRPKVPTRVSNVTGYF